MKRFPFQQWERWDCPLKSQSLRNRIRLEWSRKVLHSLQRAQEAEAIRIYTRSFSTEGDDVRPATTMEHPLATSFAQLSFHRSRATTNRTSLLIISRYVGLVVRYPTSNSTTSAFLAPRCLPEPNKTRFSCYRGAPTLPLRMMDPRPISRYRDALIGPGGKRELPREGQTTTATERKVKSHRRVRGARARAKGVDPSDLVGRQNPTGQWQTVSALCKNVLVIDHRHRPRPTRLHEA